MRLLFDLTNSIAPINILSNRRFSGQIAIDMDSLSTLSIPHAVVSGRNVRTSKTTCFCRKTLARKLTNQHICPRIALYDYVAFMPTFGLQAAQIEE